jgi:hypothetical protein
LLEFVFGKEAIIGHILIGFKKIVLGTRSVRVVRVRPGVKIPGNNKAKTPGV